MGYKNLSPLFKRGFLFGLAFTALTCNSAYAQCEVAGTDFDTSSDLCCPTLKSDNSVGGWYDENLDWTTLCGSNMFTGPELTTYKGIGGAFSSDGSNDMTKVDDVFHLNNLQADGSSAQYGYSTVTAQPKLVHPFCKANASRNNMYVNIGSAPQCPIFSYTVHGLTPGSTAELSFTLHNLLDPTYFDHLATNVCKGTGPKVPQMQDFITKYNYSNTGVINGNKLGFGVVSSDDNVTFNTSYNNALQLTNSKNATSATADYGASTSVTHKATVPETGSVTFYFYRTSDCFQIPIGIDDLTVTGEIKPNITSTGNACPDQPLRIATKQSYPAGTTFSWKESVTGQSSTDPSFNFIPEKPDTDYSVTLEVTLPGCKPAKSDVLKIHSGICCTSADGAPMAMTNLFFDDFGNFPSDDTYEWTDRFGITHTEKIPAGQVHISQSHGGNIEIPYVKAYNIESSGAKLVVPVIGSDPSKKQLYDHGVYAVSKYGGYPNGVKYDNSGTQTGGMLQFDLLDDGSQDEFFEIDIDHICTGKEITFGADFASISDHPGSIEVKLEHSGKTLASEIKDFTGGSDGWKNVNKSFTINAADVGGLNEVSIKMKVKHNNVITGQTRDYAIDNIIFQVCTPPDVNVESSVSTGKDILDLCTEDVLTLKSITAVAGQAASESAVTRFYTYSNGAPDPSKKVGYVYQYTFEDPSTESDTNPIKWETLHKDEVIEQEIFDVKVEDYWTDIFSKLENDPSKTKRIYFRVVVGEYSDLLNDQSWKTSSAFSPCRKISISTIPIVAGLNCAACVKAEQPEIIGAAGTTITTVAGEKVINLCDGEIAHLTTEKIVTSDPTEMGVADPTSPHKYIATWHRGAKDAPAVKGNGYTDGDPTTSLDVDYVFGGKYYLKVVDLDFPGADGASCYMWDSVTINARPTPTSQLTNPADFCEGELAKEPDLTIVGMDIDWYEDIDTLTRTTVPTIGTHTAGTHTYYYVVKDPMYGCRGAVNKLEFTVNEIPAKLTVPSKVEYVKGTGYVDISKEINPTPDTDCDVVYTDDNDVPTPSQPAQHDISKEDKTGVYYGVYQENTLTGCKSEISKVLVIVNDAPAPTVRDTVVCFGEGVADLSILVKQSLNAKGTPYELLWYNTDSDAPESGTAAPKSLDASATDGEYYFYVGQRDPDTKAISTKSTITVTVIEVKAPTARDLSYCANDAAAPLIDNITKTDPSYDLDWYVDKTFQTAGEPTVNTAKTSTDTTRYAVAQTYTIPSSKEVCKSDSIGFNVTVTHISKPTTNMVTYLSGDIVNNTFAKNLLQQNPNAAVANVATNNIVWYDANKNKIGNVPPTPISDPTMVTAGQDQTFTYYVKETDGKCESDFEEVTVIISSTPVPWVKNVELCEGETVPTLDLLAGISILGNGDAETDYELVWVADLTSTADIGAPTISSAIKDPTNTEEVTSYYVRQMKKADGSLSSAVKLDVKVYAKPILVDKALPAVCEGTIDLRNGWAVANGVNLTLSAEYTQNTASVVDEKHVDKSGAYSVVASFDVNTLGTTVTCSSKPQEMTVTIDTLTVAIDGTPNTCPNTPVTLTANTTTGVNYKGAIIYNWTGAEVGAATAADKEMTSNNLAGKAGDKFSFDLEVTAGSCTKKAKTHSVTLGDGPIVGSITVTEADKVNTELNTGRAFDAGASKGTFEIYTCGTEVTIDASNLTADANSTYSWTNGTTQEGSTPVLTVNPTGKTTYRLTYVNQCATFIDVTIIPVPLTVGGEITKPEICEGEASLIDAEVKCTEKASLDWEIDGVAAPQHKDKIKLTFDPAKPEDSGKYTCVVKNRACVREINSQTLLVKPIVQFTVEKDEYVIRRDSSITIPTTITVPATGEPAQISWTDAGTEVGTAKDLPLTVTKDYDLTVSMQEDKKYCESTKNVSVKVDARLSLKADLPDKMCRDEKKTLIIDTTGTGKFVYPSKMSLVVEQSMNGNKKILNNSIFTKNSDGKLEATVSPEYNATYTITFLYREGEGVDQQKIVIEKDITVLQKIDIVVPTDLVVCSGDEVEIALTSVTPKGTTVSWVVDPTITSALDVETITANPLYDPANASDFSSFYTYKGNAQFDICETKEFEVRVKVNEPLEGELADTVVCEGSSVKIEASAYKASEYIWTSADNAETKSGPGITVSPVETTVYTVSMTRGLCKAEDSLTVNVNKNPVILQVDSLNYKKVNIVIDPAFGSAPFLYRVDDGIEDMSSEKDSLAYAKHTAYVTDAYGCMAQYDFDIVAPSIIPNKWVSPNGDGVMDRWEIPAIAETYPNAVITIFDRFGKKLIQYKGADDGWDGTYNGNDMPSTDYWYEVDIAEIDKVYIGHFTLIRR